MAPAPFQPNQAQRSKRFEKIRRNEEIRAPRVDVVAPDGKMHSGISVREALAMAQTAGLDLVEVQPSRDGAPLCKILEYGKYRYDTKKLENQRRKTSAATETKELHFSVRAAAGDVETTLRKARKFLEEKDRVQIEVRMRGREQAHLGVASKKLWDAVSKLEDIGCPDTLPKFAGRMLYVLVRPGKMPDRWLAFREQIDTAGGVPVVGRKSDS